MYNMGGYSPAANQSRSLYDMYMMPNQPRWFTDMLFSSRPIGWREPSAQSPYGPTSQQFGQPITQPTNNYGTNPYLNFLFGSPNSGKSSSSPGNPFGG